MGARTCQGYVRGGTRKWKSAKAFADDPTRPLDWVPARHSNAAMGTSKMTEHFLELMTSIATGPSVAVLWTPKSIAPFADQPGWRFAPNELMPRAVEGQRPSLLLVLRVCRPSRVAAAMTAHRRSTSTRARRRAAAAFRTRGILRVPLMERWAWGFARRRSRSETRHCGPPGDEWS
jgi:hypothetical protein